MTFSLHQAWAIKKCQNILIIYARTDLSYRISREILISNDTLKPQRTKKSHFNSEAKFLLVAEYFCTSADKHVPKLAALIVLSRRMGRCQNR